MSNDQVITSNPANMLTIGLLTCLNVDKITFGRMETLYTISKLGYT